MSAPLEKLFAVRSQVVEEMLAYLDALAVRAAALPSYYPKHLHTDEAGETPFDDIRQVVQVVEDRSAFARWLAEDSFERKEQQYIRFLTAKYRVLLHFIKG